MKNRDQFEKPFEPGGVEARVREFWQQNGFFKAKRDPAKKPYTIVIPPPNVTGDLHMGHMLNNTTQDLLIRWHRALGDSACWIPGTDHASIATEAKVTADLAARGISKKEIGREAFLEHAWTWADKYRKRIVGLLQALGISCDWDREAFTMDESYSKSVIKSFVQLYKDGLIYRGHRLVNWCPFSQSVISDEEVVPEERNSHLWHIRYPVVGQPSRFVMVATTRPETLLGDLAVAVNPGDDRYGDLVGLRVVVPICNREIPVIADNYVEKEFGTGVVKITPAHDPNDFEVGQRHNLGLLNVMNPDASMNENTPARYQGLTREAARKLIVEELTEQGLMEKIEPYRHVVGISQRGNVPIEYYLSDQWYINMKPLAELALDATRSGRLALIPAHTEKVWEHWLTNIKDWCVSRQLWWGHRIPIYTCQKCGELMCEETAPNTCSKCGHGHLVQDPDVLDTWVSSWLWPFGVHNWANPTPEQKADLDYFYPTDVIVTGADIIFFWIARMVMAGEYFHKKTPFHHVFFNGIVRDDSGRKMSKSLGNSPDIFSVIDQYGTDAMRFSLMNQLVTGSDIHWKDRSCEMGRHFVNKIWNVTRFLLLGAEKAEIDPRSCFFETLERKEAQEDALLRWIISEFGEATERSHKSIEKYDFSAYASSVYDFTWLVFCDWFVELIKPRLQENPTAPVAQETLRVSFALLDGMLRLLHPVVPYVTEEIWQQVFAPEGKASTVGFQPLPLPHPETVDRAAISYMRSVQSVVSAVRTIRGQYSLNPKTELNIFLNTDASRFGDQIPMMEALAKSSFNFNATRPAISAVSVVNDLEIAVSLEGLIDIDQEKERLTARIAKLDSIIHGITQKLANENFVAGAPSHIVDGAREQLATNERERTVLQSALAGLRA